MSDAKALGAGDIPAILAANPLTKLAAEKEEMLENVRSALARDLPKAGMFRAHSRTLSVVGGGPSLVDTYEGLTGDIAAINGSLGFLLQRGIKPWACGVLDPGDHIHTVVESVPDVFYFVASVCHPSTFEHLAGRNVILWHPSGMDELDDIPGIDLQIGGGSTMGLRWVNLGYIMGFRSFHLHGMDSSFRNRGNATHAYPDRRDGKLDPITIGERQTSLNFLHQVGDFISMLDLFATGENLDPIDLIVHGDGLLQDVYSHILAGHSPEELLRA